MALARPWRQQQEQTSVLGRRDLVAFVGIEGRQEPRAAADSVASGAGDLNRPGNDDEPGALVHLVLLKALAGREVDRDRAPLFGGGQHLRLAGLELERRRVPGLHGPTLY